MKINEWTTKTIEPVLTWTTKLSFVLLRFIYFIKI
jgi:hypothetical protein